VALEKSAPRQKAVGIWAIKNTFLRLAFGEMKLLELAYPFFFASGVIYPKLFFVLPSKSVDIN
jgi:hypothetical protein